MPKRFPVAFAALLAFTLSAFAADANKASQAELAAIKGVGPAIAGKIVEERGKAPFKDWSDLVNRVKDLGSTSAIKLSSQGLTVNGIAYDDMSTSAPASSPAPVARTRTTAPAAAAPTSDKSTGTLVNSNTLGASAAGK